MPAGGSLDHTGVIVLIASGLILGCFFTARIIAAMRLNRPKPPPHLSVYGDFPHVPGEMRPARNSEGGSSGKSGLVATRTIDGRTHRGGAVTR